jgi:hypothetical protein
MLRHVEAVRASGFLRDDLACGSHVALSTAATD